MRTIAIALLLALGACADLSSWVGHSDTQLLAKNGAPDGDVRTSSGMRVLSYFKRNGYGSVICRQNFTVDRAGTIVAYTSNCNMM